MEERTSSLTSWALFLALLGSFFYFYVTMVDLAPSTIVRSLMSSFHLKGSTVGILDTLYFAAFALMQIPGGYLLDRFGGRIVLTISAACCALGLFLLASASTFSVALLGRILSGIGATGGLLGAMYLIHKYLPLRYLGLALGLAIMVGLAGGLFGTPLALLANDLGWRWMIGLLACLACLIALLFLLFLRDPPHRNTPAPWPAFKSVITMPQMWAIALYGALMYTPTGTLGSFWGIEYLKVYFNEHYNLLVTSMTSMIFLGWIIGSPIAGWISDRLQQRRSVALAGGLLTLLALLVLGCIIHLPVWSLYFVMLLIGLGSSCSGLTFAMGCDNAPPQCGGVTIGFINMIAIFPTILITPLFGMILDHFWQGTTLNGARIYSLKAYQSAMVLEYSIILIALFIGWLWMRESIKFATASCLPCFPKA